MTRIYVLIFFLFVKSCIFANPVLFKIGTPDSSAAEFKTFESFNAARYFAPYSYKFAYPYSQSKEFFSKQICYDMDINSEKDFPYLYPVAHCEWADNQSPSVKIKFNLKNNPKENLFFKLGFSDASRREIFLSIAVNEDSRDIESQQIPYAHDKTSYPFFANIIYNPKAWGIGKALCFEIPPSKLHEGENFIELKATTNIPFQGRFGAIWFAYDYIEISENPALPEQPNFRAEIKEKFKQSLKDEDSEIVFALRRRQDADEHWYANIGRLAEVKTCDASINELMGRKLYSLGDGKLVKYNLKTEKATVLFADEGGAVRDPCVSYDGKTILFSYRPADSEYYSLCEIDVDGNNFKKLPCGGKWNDYESTYLPNGDIVFVSDRCKRMVPCYASNVGILHRYFKDENVVRAISTNMDQDNTPWVAQDGKIVYMRWDYIHRSHVWFHHLWKKNPDGSNDIAYFGNEIPDHLFIDPKPIPNTNDMVFTFGPYHSCTNHSGYIARLNSPKNPSDAESVEFITGDLPSAFFTPYPIDDNYTIATNIYDLLVFDRQGHIIDNFNIPAEILTGTDNKTRLQMTEPRIIKKRNLDPIVPDIADYDEQEATIVVMDTSIGRNMKNVKHGDIKKLMIVEILPFPAHTTGGMEPFTLTGEYNLERILGTVNVEDDSSANFKVPAGRALSFIALDKDGKCVKRMQSSIDFIEGTTISCIGCHENRDMAPPQNQNTLKALQRPTENITPFTDAKTMTDYPRDIQPIWDAHCISCHNPDDYKASLDLRGDFGPMFIRSYYNLRVRRIITDGYNHAGNMHPYSFGSGGSPLMTKLEGNHHNVKLSEQELKAVMTWLDTGAMHAGTSAAIETGQLGALVLNRETHPDKDWQETKELAQAIENRCDECHSKEKFLPKMISGQNDLQPWQWLTSQDKNNIRNRLSHHAIYNLTNPRKSNVLMTPLNKDAGGRADGTRHKIIFENTNDIDYQKILKAIKRGQKYLYEENPHYTFANFKIPYSYWKKMIEYGIIKEDEPIENLNPFELDEKYWQIYTGPKEYKCDEE